VWGSPHGRFGTSVRWLLLLLLGTARFVTAALISISVRPVRGAFLLLERQAKRRELPLLLFILNCNQHTAKIAPGFEKFLKTFSIEIRSGGIAVGVVAHEAPVRMVQSYEMGTQLPLFAPPVEENAAVRSGSLFVEAFPINDEIYRKSPVFEAQGRAPEGGACVSVNQGQLPFVVTDQLIDVCPVSHQQQRVIGGNPAAARGGGGPEPIPVLIFGDMILVIDQIIHLMLPGGVRQ